MTRVTHWMVSVICFVAVIPSPLAVTVRTAVPAFAVEAAVSVNWLVPVAPLIAGALLLHAAVTPVGRPVTLKLAAPL